MGKACPGPRAQATSSPVFPVALSRAGAVSPQFLASQSAGHLRSGQLPLLALVPTAWRQRLMDTASCDCVHLKSCCCSGNSLPLCWSDCPPWRRWLLVLCAQPGLGIGATKGPYSIHKGDQCGPLSSTFASPTPE